MPATAIAAPPCPAWCTRPKGHEDGCDIDGSRFIRHRVVVGDVEVEQPVIVEPGGEVETEPLVVWVDGHAYDEARAQRLVHDVAQALDDVHARRGRQAFRRQLGAAYEALRRGENPDPQARQVRR